jgi:rubrerythrin
MLLLGMTEVRGVFLPPELHAALKEHAAKLLNAYKPKEKEKEQEPGAWTCNVCGFRGFWSGGPHCDGEKS